MILIIYKNLHLADIYEVILIFIYLFIIYC